MSRALAPGWAFPWDTAGGFYCVKQGQARALIVRLPDLGGSRRWQVTWVAYHDTGLPLFVADRTHAFLGDAMDCVIRVIEAEDALAHPAPP